MTDSMYFSDTQSNELTERNVHFTNDKCKMKTAYLTNMIIQVRFHINAQISLQTESFYSLNKITSFALFSNSRILCGHIT